MATTIFQRAIQRAWATGHFWSPNNPNGPNVKQDQLVLLRPTDETAIQALVSLAKSDVAVYTRQVLEKHGRLPDFDGEVGPAMAAFIDVPRCPVPDHAPPPGVVFSFDDPNIQQIAERMQADGAAEAVGPGNWKSCHRIGNFHAATVGVDKGGLPSFLEPVFIDVLKNVRSAYAGVGLLWKFINNGTDMLTGESFTGNINTEMSFVSRSDGWIGLAIVGQNENCSSKIWCKFLATYKGGSTNAAIIQQWTSLIKHELGHNCGKGHTNGGVMNPSIVNGLPTEWNDSDPTTPWLKNQFGGVPVPIPGGDPVPPTPPDNSIEKQLFDLRLANVIQDVQIQWLIDKSRGT